MRAKLKKVLLTTANGYIHFLRLLAGAAADGVSACESRSGPYGTKKTESGSIEPTTFRNGVEVGIYSGSRVRK